MDLLLILIGSGFAIVTGVGMPLLSIIMGDMGQSFVDATTYIDSPNFLGNCLLYENVTILF